MEQPPVTHPHRHLPRLLPRRSIRALALAAGLAVPLLVASPGTLGADGTKGEGLPIKSITLYRSGVGFFERRGLVQDDTDVHLKFATERINDILKSMILLDLDGGRIDSVGYGSKEPLQRRLASFGIDLSGDPSAGKILASLRGTPVRISTNDGDISGTILNVENRPTIIQGSGQTPPAKHDLPWINLVTPTGVRSVNLTGANGFQLLDPALNEELNKALAALAEHHADRVKTVDVALRGHGSRQIVVGYVHEMPVWKTSYRLILPDTEGAKDKSAQLNIQGWAIVENTTDEDWENVGLSLVAGRPVSFQMDLYEPLHVERPEIPVPMVAAALARVYSGGQDVASVDLAKAAELERADKAAPASAPARRSIGYALKDKGELDAAARESSRLGVALTGEDLAGYSAASQAAASEIGEVFEYRLKEPVTVERQRSAMLPILTSAIDGRRVSIYNRADATEHPMRGVELKNGTGMQLMPGPISVFDGPAYAGDAQIGHITLGDKRLLAYAVDLDVSAMVTENSTQTIQKIRIVQGGLEQTTLQKNGVKYAFTNKDAKRPRTLIVEHPKLANWELVEPKKPSEATEALYRFEVAIDPAKSGEFSVVQQQVERTRLGITSIDLPTLLAYSKDGKVSQKVIDAVQEAARRQAAINDSQQRLAQLDAERATIDADQARIRQNMNAIAKESDLYRRYVTKLNEQESRLEAIKDARDKEQQNLDKLRADLDAYLRGLDVE